LFEGAEAIKFILGAQKKFVISAIQYLTAYKDNESGTANTSYFMMNMVTYLNRIIIIDQSYFLSCLAETQAPLSNYMAHWIKTSDFIVSRESQRINILAMCILLPQLPAQELQKEFSDFCRLSLHHVDQYIYLKLTNSPTLSYSPNTVEKCVFPYGGTQAMKGKNVRFIIQCADKMSQRLDSLRLSDPLVGYDL